MIYSLARRCELTAAYATGVLREWLGTRLEARQREPGLVDVDFGVAGVQNGFLEKALGVGHAVGAALLMVCKRAAVPVLAVAAAADEAPAPLAGEGLGGGVALGWHGVRGSIDGGPLSLYII